MEGERPEMRENQQLLANRNHGFTRIEIASLAALCNTFFPSLPLEARSSLNHPHTSTEDVYQFYRASGSAPWQVAETMNEILKPADLRIVKRVLCLLSTSAGTFILGGRFSLTKEFPYVHKFGDLAAQRREELLLSWSTSSFSFFRAIFQAFKTSVFWSNFTTVDEQGRNPLWKAIGYCGPDPLAMSSPLTPRPLSSCVIDVSVDGSLGERGDHRIECDVVIVGSGSGGGVAAAVLAKAGFKVVVVEKGGYFARHDLSLLEGISWKQLYEQQGMLMTQDHGVHLLAGSTVGGGSAVNWSTSFRTPHHVLREWSDELNIRLFSSDRYKEAMDQICKRLGVQGEVKSENLQNRVLREGCQRLGYQVATIPRNAAADHYCGWCGFGCRLGIKQATSETWLVDAARDGALILTRCTVHQVLHVPNNHPREKPRRAVGVLATMGSGESRRRLIIEAKATVVACGSLHTPPLLHRSGLQNCHIGKNLHLHPAQIAWGYLPPGTLGEGNCYEGGIQTAFTNEAAHWDSSGYGALIETPVLHPGLFASAMPWSSGSHFKQTMLRYSRTCHLVWIVRDKGSGTVGSNGDGTLRVCYKLSPDDHVAAREGVEKALRVLLAGGAVEVGTHLPDVGSFQVDGKGDFEEYLKRVAGKIREAQMFSAHQLGSCRMGVSEEESAVDEKCESWEVQGLYVADGSAVPTAIGVNPMVTIQSLAFCTAHNVLEYLSKRQSNKTAYIASEFEIPSHRVRISGY